MVLPLGDQGDNRMRCFRIQFSRVSAAETADVACKFNHGKLHTKANAEVRNVVLTGVFDGFDLAFGTAFAETAGNQNSIHAFEAVGAFFFKDFSFDEGYIHMMTGMDTGVNESFIQRLIRILQVILADHGKFDGVLRMFKTIDDLFPSGKIGGFRIQV